MSGGGKRSRARENVGRLVSLCAGAINSTGSVGRERHPGGTIRESFGVSIGVLVQVDSYDSETHCPPLQARSLP